MPLDPVQPQGWRARLLTVEALVLLAAARLLVAGVRFRRWRGLLGHPGQRALLHDVMVCRLDRYLARVVERASTYLPFETKCLPRAMALHWMLARRARPAELVLAVLAGSGRGGALDDLHAWVELDEQVLIGASELTYIEVARFTHDRIESLN